MKSLSTVPPSEEVAAIERELAELWRRVLKTDSIDRNDRFFECGGDSLKAMEFTAEITRRYGADVPMANLLESNMGEIATMLARHKPPGLIAAMVGRFRRGSRNG
jgi:polyketide synthase PksJ